MRELGSYGCSVGTIFDVAPDLWACAYDEAANKQWVIGPKGVAKVLLLPALALAQLQDDETSTTKPTAGRFHTVPTADNTYDVALGYSNGDVCVYNRAGYELFALQCHRGAVARLEWNFHSAKPSCRELYVLFADMTLVVIEWELADPTSPKRYWRKYSLNGQRDIIGILPCAVTRAASLFQSQPRAGLQSFVAVGCDPVVGFYHAGHEGTSLFRIAHLASAVATRAAGAVWSLAKNWGWPQDRDNDTVDAVPSDLGIHVALGLPDSHRRRARDLNVSPNGKLALVPDTLGRILLIDTTSMLLIRLWKGYRDAQCGWMTHNDGLYMVFYSGRRGLVEVWRARHGPRVLCLPLGAHAKLKLYTCMAAEFATCVVVWEQSNGESALYQVELDSGSLTTEVQYLSKAKGEHESFVVHQLVDGLGKCLIRPALTTALLDQMKGLTTIEGVETVLDALHEPKMGPLPASFHRDALKILLQVATNARDWGKTQADFADLVFLFNLEYKTRLVRGFVDLQQEVTTTPFAAAAALFDDDNDSLLTRMTKWRSVYSFSTTQITSSPLNCLQFIDCFAFPWSEPMSPEVELSLGLLLHKTHRNNVLTFDECIRQLYAMLKSPVLRSATDATTHAAFVSFLFAPLHGAVFAVQHVQEIHQTLLLDQDTLQYTSQFLEWYFALPEDMLLGMTATNASSCLQRWLQPWLLSCSFPHSIDEASFTLPALSPSLQAVYDRCRSTPLLLHAFVLCEHVAYGLAHHANALQDSTLGQVSAMGAGLRWRVLQQCLSQCLYFSCLLKVPGKLTVNAIEASDELMKFVAIVHLNTPKDSSTGDPEIPYDAHDNWIQTWTYSSKSHAVKSVLTSFRQLDHPDSIAAFRALMLCTAWNNDRSRMSLLGLAIQEVDRLDGGDAPLKTALIVLLWDTYVREQVASIMDFWLQASTGARSSKGLDPSIAGEFLHLAQQLLQVLSESIKSAVNTTRLAPPTDRHDDDDDSVDPSARFSPDEALDLDQLLAPVVWTGTPNDVMNLYSKQWPSSPLHSALMQQLTRPGSPPTQESVDQHHQLVSVLIAFTSYPAAVVPLPSLFDLTSLCKSPSFKEAAELPANNVRFQFTMDLLRHDISLGMSVASSLHLQLDQIKQAHAVWLYQGGQDALAEEVLDKVVVDATVVTLLARVARSRLGLVLCRMQSRSEFAVLMSQLPADTCSWIRSSAPPLRPDPQVGIRDAAPSLTATNALLHQCVQWMPPASPEHARCLAMIGIVQLLLSQLKKSTNLASRKQNA